MTPTLHLATPKGSVWRVVHRYTTLILLVAIKINEALHPAQEKCFSFMEMRCFPLLETFLLDTAKCKAQVVPTAQLQMICQA